MNISTNKVLLPVKYYIRLKEILENKTTEQLPQKEMQPLSKSLGISLDVRV